jgi:hypothetical protein
VIDLDGTGKERARNQRHHAHLDAARGEETGNLIADAVAVMPGVTGTTARAAGKRVRVHSQPEMCRAAVQLFTTSG